MDELGRVIADLMNNLPAREAVPQEQSPASAAGPGAPVPPGPPPGGAAPAGMDHSVGTNSSAGGDPGAELAALLPGLGGGNLMEMLGAAGGGMPSNQRVQLLQALKPYLRPARRDQVDRLCRLINAAYGVRGTLRSLGGMLHV